MSSPIVESTIRLPTSTVGPNCDVCVLSQGLKSISPSIGLHLIESRGLRQSTSNVPFVQSDIFLSLVEPQR